MIITDILAAVLVYKVAYMLFPVPEPICYQYEGVLRILLNYDLLLFVLLLSLAVGGDSTRYALGYAYLFVCRVVLLAWEWVILPCLASASRCCVRLLWPDKGQVQPVASVLLPASELTLPAPSSVASPPASPLRAAALPLACDPPAVVLPAAPVPFERPFLRPGSPATPHPVSSCAACAELQASLTPATSDVPVAALSSGWDFVSPASVSPAFSVPSAASVGSSAVPAATDVPVTTPSSAALVVPAAPTATNVVFVPAVVDAAVTEDPPASVLSAASALPVAVASVPAPAPLLSAASALPVAVASVRAPAPATSSGRGVRFIVSRGGGVIARRGVVHAHKKVGETTSPSELRRAARAALAAGIVKPAPFCVPVVGAAAAAASSVSCVGSWPPASARTVKVARKPARRIVSVRRLLRPAVRKEITEQKAAIVVRRRVTAARRRTVAARLALFARRAAAAVVAPPAPAFSSAGVVPSVPGFSPAGVAPGAGFSFAVLSGPAIRPAVCRPPPLPRAPAVCRPPPPPRAPAIAPAVCRPPPPPRTPAVASAGVFRVPAVPCSVGRPEAVSAGGFAVPAPVSRPGAAAASVFSVPAPVRWKPVSAGGSAATLASLAARRPPAVPLSSVRVSGAGGADSRPAGCTCPVVPAAEHPAAIARPVPCSCPAVARFGCPSPVNGRPKTNTGFAGQQAAIARPAVAVYASPVSKKETTSRQASGSTPAASSSSSLNASSSKATRRIAIPRPQRRSGAKNL
ncbi:hypothetical protein [Parasitella parasitica]|uniref:Uncharacterized protein n=1 Tax=Parasitella parasitica TaxID=35722 RepID=A0A0B7N445_9FUNG|nr:hypothetical protein [Parasitella parasitica]